MVQYPLDFKSADVQVGCHLQAVLLICPFFRKDDWIISAFTRLLLHLHQLLLGNFEIYQQVSSTAASC